MRLLRESKPVDALVDFVSIMAKARSDFENGHFDEGATMQRSDAIHYVMYYLMFLLQQKIGNAEQMKFEGKLADAFVVCLSDEGQAKTIRAQDFNALSAVIVARLRSGLYRFVYDGAITNRGDLTACLVVSMTKVLPRSLNRHGLYQHLNSIAEIILDHKKKMLALIPLINLSLDWVSKRRPAAMVLFLNYFIERFKRDMQVDASWLKNKNESKRRMQLRHLSLYQRERVLSHQEDRRWRADAPTVSYRRSLPEFSILQQMTESNWQALFSTLDACMLSVSSEQVCFEMQEWHADVVVTNQGR